MKKFASWLLCLVLLLALFPVNVAAAEEPCMEATAAMSDDGIVTVVVLAAQSAANARLHVTFDSACLTYVGYETAFAAHSVQAGEEKLTIGLANASASPVKAGEELVRLTFAVNGTWSKTELTVTAENYGGKKVNETVTLTVQGNGPRFVDVPEGEWYAEAVNRMAADGYIKGVSADHYGPEQEMIRADFVTLLGRLAGEPEKQGQTHFTDVVVDSYYSGYVAWGVEKGIVKGVSATLFGTEEPVERAQMVTFLYRYAASLGMDMTVEDPEAALAQFSDGDELPDWSEDAFIWAVDRGIINGKGGRLAPEETSTRAQVAVMLYRFFYED